MVHEAAAQVPAGSGADRAPQAGPTNISHLSRAAPHWPVPVTMSRRARSPGNYIAWHACSTRSPGPAPLRTWTDPAPATSPLCSGRNLDGVPRSLSAAIPSQSRAANESQWVTRSRYGCGCRGGRRLGRFSVRAVQQGCTARTVSRSQLLRSSHSKGGGVANRSPRYRRRMVEGENHEVLVGHLEG